MSNNQINYFQTQGVLYVNLDKEAISSHRLSRPRQRAKKIFEIPAYTTQRTLRIYPQIEMFVATTCSTKGTNVDKVKKLYYYPKKHSLAERDKIKLITRKRRVSYVNLYLTV